MPKIQWTGLPVVLRDHLFERVRDRQITANDLYELKLWRESEPEAPEGPWFKDFGSFKSAAKVSTRRLSSCADKRQEGENSELATLRLRRVHRLIDAIQHGRRGIVLNRSIQ